jgi:S-formylglutathione hydrolase
MISDFALQKQYACHGGTLSFYSHWSKSCNSTMNFSLYLPPTNGSNSLPTLYFLAGLTCTEENFMAKAGALRSAAECGIAILAPDTSPRNCNLPGADDSWDFGTGASFYVDATEAPWSKHYQMYTYITEELPALATANFNLDPNRQSISGHSMGGHGALVCGLRNRDRYRSISAFAPVAAPSQCPWGQRAFSNYLGDPSLWSAYDATELAKAAGDDSRSILIDQGLSDPFLAEQLLPDLFVKACRETNLQLTYREQLHYDHSYYFIATFVEDHIRFHARHLNP